MLKHIFLIIVFFNFSLNGDDKLTKLKELYKNHEVRKHQTWQNWQDTPLNKRISIAPKNIIEYIRLDNQIFNFQGIPKTVIKDPKFDKDFKDALDELPLSVKKQLEKYLIGIFFIKDLGSTGFSEHLYKDGKYYGGWLVFDQEVLSKLKANQWATWRVNTAFKPSDKYKLTLNIQNSKNNNTRQAIQFILLHEIGHIIGSATKAHPNPNKLDKEDPKNFPYSSISWLSLKKSIYDKEFKNRKDFKLYRFDNAKLELKESKELIKNLKNTDFPSLYGSDTFLEDYAESYAIYIHTQMMNKPYELTLYHDGKKIESFSNPFKRKIMLKKREFFDKLMDYQSLKSL